MNRGDLVEGRAYALRVKGAPSEDPFVKAVYVGPARSHQVKVRHSGGDLDGLVEWVKTANIACSWGERRAVARDEKRQRALVQAAKADRVDVWEDAISVVFEAIGEEGGFTRTWDTTRDTAERTWDRAGLDGNPLMFDILNYTDRHGDVHLSYRTALHVAQAFASAEPETVELHIRITTERLKSEGFQPGNRFAHECLIRTGPTHALALSWTKTAHVEAREQEIQRLQAIISDAARALRKAGDDRSADRIERARRGG